MSTIVTRAGKGSPLTNTEVDANFTNLNTDKLESSTAASTYVSLTGSYANPSWITSLAETKVLPVQTSNAGKYLTTNGTNTSWVNVPPPNNGTLSLTVSGTGLSGSASFTADQAGNSTFTVTSNATSANTASTIVARDGSGNFSASAITGNGTWVPTSWATTGSFNARGQYGGVVTLINTGGSSDGFSLALTGSTSQLNFYYGANAGTASAVASISSTGVVTASSFSGAGTGLTGTASSLTAGTANALNTANNYTIANQLSFSHASAGGYINSADGSWGMVLRPSVAGNQNTYFLFTNNTGGFLASIGTNGYVNAAGFNGSGSGLTGTAASLSIGGTATTATTANALNTANSYTVAGLTVGNTSNSSITMVDTDEGNRTIHCNSNRIGFLTQAGAWGSYCNDDGSWSTDVRLYAPGWTTTGRNYSNEWIQFDNYSGLYSPLNNAHFFPNDASYGPWKVRGTRNGWGGIEFENATTTLMMNYDTYGFHRNDSGWRFYNSGGSGYFPGEVQAGYSDKRLKENFRPLGSEALELVNKFEVYRFNWNAKVAELKLPIEVGSEEVGCVAQEVQVVFPDAVAINKATNIMHDDGTETETDYLTINYERITPLLIQAVKDLTAQIATLKAEVGQLRGEV